MSYPISLTPEDITIAEDRMVHQIDLCADDLFAGYDLEAEADRYRRHHEAQRRAAKLTIYRRLERLAHPEAGRLEDLETHNREQRDEMRAAA